MVWRDVIRAALAEDRVREDVTTALLGPAGARPVGLRFIAEGRIVAAGIPLVAEAYAELDPAVTVRAAVEEGEQVDAGAVLAEARGPASALLSGERVVLNFLQHVSGIATATRRIVDLVAGTGAQVTHTRKTIPGLRALALYGVRMGGGVPNRTSLADGVMWKDNHWALLRGPSELEKVVSRVEPGLPLVVEVESELQLEVALAAGATHLLVDNQPPAEVARWVRRAGAGVIIQASGGITEANARAYAEAGAALLAIGSITHSAPSAPIRCDLVE
jgi:nicotinate-nucleotide pyrophosphorylase (carboxylating)